MAAFNITAEVIRERFNYDPLTGVFTWKNTVSHNAKRGAAAGSICGNGYIRLLVFKTPVYAHRAAFLYMTGKFPEHDVDHINGITSDNKWNNLRDVSRSVNMENQRKAKTNNLSAGLLGVYSDRRYLLEWGAAICINGKQKYLGRFATKEEAHAAYVEAKRKHHPGCTL